MKKIFVKQLISALLITLMCLKTLDAIDSESTFLLKIDSRKNSDELLNDLSKNNLNKKQAKIQSKNDVNYNEEEKIREILNEKQHQNEEITQNTILKQKESEISRNLQDVP